MNRFYRKPKPETMKANRELFAQTMGEEIKWLKENLETLQETKTMLENLYKELSK